MPPKHPVSPADGRRSGGVHGDAEGRCRDRSPRQAGTRQALLGAHQRRGPALSGGPHGPQTLRLLPPLPEARPDPGHGVCPELSTALKD